MNKTTIISITFSIMAIINYVSAQTFKEVKNANDVIENSITAMGGKEYLMSIKTLYTDMSTEMEGRQVNWITKEMLPNKGSFEIVYKDRIMFKSWYNGKVGYEMVNGETKKADPEEFKSKEFKKNIFNELDFIDSTIWTIEMIGEEEVNDQDCFKIQATCINGEVKVLYFSKTTFFQLREDKVSNSEKGTYSTTYFSEFKKFGNLYYYSVIKFGDDDQAQLAKVVSLLVNEKISSKDFK